MNVFHPRQRWTPTGPVFRICFALLIPFGVLHAAIAQAPPQIPNGEAGRDPAGLEANVVDGAAAPGDQRTGVIIQFSSEIHSLTEQYLYRKLDDAKQRGASVIVIEIDSPGGDVEATMRIAQRLRDTEATTVAYVPRQALSGAALFALGCDQIVMHPQAVFGDAGPVFLDEDFLFKHASEKVRSHLARQARDLAQAAGRPPALAEAMVDMNLVVYRVTNRETNEQTFLSQAEIESSPNPEVWQKNGPVLESRKEHFLEVNGQRAVELNLADAVVPDRDRLKQRYANVERWVEMQWSSLDAVVLVLNHPVVTGLIFIVGLAALYFELAAPGLGIGGVVSLICFGLFFWSRFLGGTGQWLEVILFLAGCALLVVEVFVIPGFGIWGLSGITLIVGALIAADQSFFIPQTTQDLNQLTRTLATVLLSGFAFILIAAWITRRIGKIPILSQLMLGPPPSSLAADSAHVNSSPETGRAVVDGFSVQVGDRGVAESALRPAGRVRIGEGYFDVVSDGSFIAPGELVRVIEAHGNRVVVRGER